METGAGTLQKPMDHQNHGFQGRELGNPGIRKSVQLLLPCARFEVFMTMQWFFMISYDPHAQKQ